MNEQYNNNGYNDPYNQYDPYNPYGAPQQPVNKPKWAAITSFVLSIINIVSCCCMTYILAPISIVFGIISLVKKWSAKGLAIAGTIISSVVLVLTLAMNIVVNTVFKEPYEDMTKFISNADSYAEEYHRTKEIPEEFQKYCAPEYDDFWHSMGYDDFNDFYEEYIEAYEKSRNINSDNYNDRYDNDDDDGRKHVDL